MHWSLCFGILSSVEATVLTYTSTWQNVLKWVSLTSISTLIAAIPSLLPAASPHLPLFFIHTSQTCQRWKYSHFMRLYRHQKQDLLMWDVGMVNGKGGNAIRIHGPCSNLPYTHMLIYTCILGFPHNFSHGTEMKTSCLACGDDHEDTRPELAPHWQWRSLGPSVQESWLHVTVLCRALMTYTGIFSKCLPLRKLSQTQFLSSRDDIQSLS